MKTNWFKYGLVLLCSLYSLHTLAQGEVCATIEPFCAGSEELVFGNSNGQNSFQVNGESGPSYNCLLTQPYPSWFYLQVENTGKLRFTISQFENSNGGGAVLDVDFIVWGPFDKGDKYCNPGSLSAQNVIDCSYSEAGIEQMNIANAQEDEIYVVLITNFSAKPGFIRLEQTNTNQQGAGTTDCSILNNALGEDKIVCGETEFLLDGTTEGAATYEWFFLNENTGNFEVIPNENNPTLLVTQSGTYQIRVTDQSGENEEEEEVEVTFFDKPTAQNPGILYSCSTEDDFVDLPKNEAKIIAGNTPKSEYEVIYYASNEDLELNNYINDPSNFSFTEDQTIYARVRAVKSNCVSEPVSFKIKYYQFPEYELAENSVFCVDLNQNLLGNYTLGKDLGNDFDYEWFGDGNSISINPLITFAQTPGYSQISLEITHKETGCVLSLESKVQLTSAPAEVAIDISGSDFGDGYVVTASPDGGIQSEATSYEYSLDNGTFQQSNIFKNVPPGNHQITVREANACGEIGSKEFQLVGYPRFFTPNGDGYNDTWKIINKDKLEIKNLYIFDRYGRLLKQLNPDGAGWDGVYNSKNLPADDYWFKIEFIDSNTGELKKYGANFTLLR